SRLTEWFVQGTEPTRDDDWEQGKRIVLPDEYAEWSQSGLKPVVTDRATLGPTKSEPKKERRVIASDSTPRFRLLSPRDGDRYSIPPGVDARYSTIPLRAGGPGAERVEWTVDGKAYEGERWPLAPGEHVIGARSSRGEKATARIRISDEP